MSLLDTASLLLTPNAYKEGKLYSVIPSDGSGDFTFTRATTATRVNSNGLVELVPYNLLQYSEQFDNAAWIKAGTNPPVVTANQGTAPDGTLTADRLLMPSTATTSIAFQNISHNSGTVYTISAYVKTNTSINQTFRIYGDASISISPTLTATSEWQRFTFTYTASATGSRSAGFYYIPNTQSDLLVWGAQLVEGSTALPYQKTETRLNIPRLDYSNGTCPSILLEPQRTNLLQQSSSFDNVYWGKGNVSVSANTTTAPDGTLTADKIIENTSNSNHEINHSNVPLSATSYSYSVYAKADGRNWIALSIQSQYTFFDLQNGVVGSSAVGNVNDIKSVGNGWYRCTITRTAAAANNFGLIRLALDDNTPTYTGDGTSGIYLWGAQLEAGSYATSYIPTTTASVTRNADVCSKTGISSLIGQTQGTLYFELKDFVDKDTVCITIDDGTNNNRFLLYREPPTGRFVLFVAISGVFYNTASTISENDGKFAIAYNGSGFVVYRNGVQIITSTNAVPNNLSAIRLNGRATNDFYTLKKVYATALWKTRLTNDQLAQLTSL